MVKTNLPIIFLRKFIILPNNDVRLELSSEMDKLVLGLAELNHDNHLLLVNLKDPLEERPSLSELPKIAVLGKIKSKIELPNGIIRTVISGLDRVEILNYIKNEQTNAIEAFVIPIREFEIDEFEASALRRILFRDLDNYINAAEYMSNSVLGKIAGLKNIGVLSDIIAYELPLAYEQKIKYVSFTNPLDRTRSIIEDLNKELETIKLENDIENSLKKSLDNGQKEYILREKIKIIKEELGDTDYKEEDTEELKTKINSLDISDKVRTLLNNELKKYELTPASSPELTVIRNYITWLLDLPWNIFTKDNDDIIEVKKILNNSHYGLEEVKTRIVEYIAVNKNTNGNIKNIICLIGPPGTGKTSLAKSIALALNKKFIKISVGGVNDEAEIMGHRRTYIGASPGKIIEGIKKASSSNPVFLIDEIDKMTKDYRGDPASALLDVLDKEQNSIFTDNYINEEFDLSKVMFILTANDEYAIPEPLRDRLEIIRLSSYTHFEKLDITKKYLIPKLLKEYNINKNIVFEDNAILTIIKNYTNEAGVRELERLISKILRKLIVGNNFDTKITTKNLSKYLGKEKYLTIQNDTFKNVGVINGLAYTTHGGAILKVSSTIYPSKENKLVLTGSLGNIMKESIEIALSYIKTNAKKFNIDMTRFEKNTIHIHFEEGAIPKDGPSAGVTITTSLLSLLKNKIIPHNISMTGEITLRGAVLPIGGIKEKIIAAITNNIKIIYLPIQNKRDVEEIDNKLLKEIIIIYVNDYEEIYNKLFFETNS